MASTTTNRIASVAALAFLLSGVNSFAADITVTALFNGKAMLVVNGGKPRTLAIGESTPDGVKLLSATSESAVVEHAGQRHTLMLGHATRVGSPAASAGRDQVTLTADSRGHFVAIGAINGISVRFLVDTGATSVALSTAEARRIGLNYLSGVRSYSSTANGVVPMYRLKLDSVRLGDITLTNVDASVLEGSGLDIALLGMSFLNRMQMQRDGDTLTLVKRF